MCLYPWDKRKAFWSFPFKMQWSRSREELMHWNLFSWILLHSHKTTLTPRCQRCNKFALERSVTSTRRWSDGVFALRLMTVDWHPGSPFFIYTALQICHVVLVLWLPCIRFPTHRKKIEINCLSTFWLAYSTRAKIIHHWWLGWHTVRVSCEWKAGTKVSFRDWWWPVGGATQMATKLSQFQSHPILLSVASFDRRQ